VIVFSVKPFCVVPPWLEDGIGIFPMPPGVPDDFRVRGVVSDSQSVNDATGGSAYIHGGNVLGCFSVALEGTLV
jgi:hypothetical protein